MRTMNPPTGMFPAGQFRLPMSLWGLDRPVPVRVARSPLQEPQSGFQSLFFPMMDMARNVFGSMMDMDEGMESPTNEGIFRKHILFDYYF